MYDESPSLAELGEISKGLIRAPKRHPRLRNPADTRPPAQVKAETRQMRDSVRARNAAEGTGNQYNNYGVPHKVGIDTPIPYATRKHIGEAVASGAGKVGTEVGEGASRALQAGGAELGREAGKSGEAIATNAKKAVHRAGLSIIAGGAAGGATFGAVANARRRRSKKETVKLDRNTGKLVIA